MPAKHQSKKFGVTRLPRRDAVMTNRQHTTPRPFSSLSTGSAVQRPAKVISVLRPHGRVAILIRLFTR